MINPDAGNGIYPDRLAGTTTGFGNGKAGINMDMKKGLIILAGVFLSASCADMQNWQKGAALGGAVGAGTGAVIGHQSDHAGEGALIGGAVGAVAGGLIGRQLDQQQAELSQIAEVQRTSEDELVVIMREQILFDVNEYSLKPGAEDNLTKISDVVVRYPDFNIIVEGHTDSTGTDQYNQTLSERRAEAVANALIARGVDPARIQTIGYGEMRPVATNETPEGRQQNRRVELHIKPKEGM
ncbi:MAG: OmpA family protein [Candidatus Abyssobacteria bacterium SURF_5]|uniref:OmpA family protein n=1 Tax=Abyssobacteria bacterium (strain SURF_5) TaxID=2093360 RepID=A0A3A4NNX9_ABYX5|nr:MAG: OmpA family protein [Candidatus Abyssubacteria bacterium SURF_5]